MADLFVLLLFFIRAGIKVLGVVTGESGRTNPNGLKTKRQTLFPFTNARVGFVLKL